MKYKYVKCEKKGKVAVVKINRPEVMNALNTDVLKELEALLDEIESDEDIYVIIFTGEGEKAFVAGADIALMREFSPREAEKFAELGQKVFSRIERMDKITISAVNGYAFGGGMEFMMCCDLCLIDEKAVIGQPEINLGLIPGFGGSQRLPRMAGVKRAMELILTGRKVDAEEAVYLGLANKKTPAGKVLDEALKLADEIVAKPFLALIKAKRCIREGMQIDIERAMEIERRNFALLFTTQDAKEGLTAFIEKRRPVFKGR